MFGLKAICLSEVFGNSSFVQSEERESEREMDTVFLLGYTFDSFPWRSVMFALGTEYVGTSWYLLYQKLYSMCHCRFLYVSLSNAEYECDGINVCV